MYLRIHVHTAVLQKGTAVPTKFSTRVHVPKYYSKEASSIRVYTAVLSVCLSSPGRHPKTSGFDVAEGRI